MTGVMSGAGGGGGGAADSRVETISRLAQWRIESLGPCSYRRSEPFKLGIWNWYLSVEKSRSVCIRLFPEPGRVAKDQPPLARFILRVSYPGPPRRSCAAAACRRLCSPSSSPRGHYSIMGDSCGSNAHGAVTRVLFCGPYWPASTNYTREYLQNYPFIQVDEVGLEQVPDVIQNYHLCVVKNKRIDSDIMAKATQMKIIMQYGVGLEGVDVNAATEHKIKVARIPGSTTGNAVSCAEMAIYLTLGVLRKQKKMDTAVNRKDLGVPVGDTLFGKTILILGFGAIGVELARRLKPFGVKVLATKRNWSSDTLPCDVDEMVDKKGGAQDMHEFAGEADIVITCMTLNNETVGIVDHKFLSSMKKGSYLINIARGRLLDYNAVFDHLKSGHLAGLGIDVAWMEPFDPEDPILKFPNVIITPHVAGVTEYSYRTMAKSVGDTALQLHSGEPFTGIEFVN